MMEKAVFLACSNAWLGESVNGKLLAISEAQGSRGKKARQKEENFLPQRGHLLSISTTSTHHKGHVGFA